MAIEAALSCGPEDAGEHVLGDGAARRPIAAAVHFAGNDRPSDRVFSPPVRGIEVESKEKGEQRRPLAIEVLDDAMQACDMVLLSNPHNPTGQVIQRSDLTDVAVRHPASILVVDESYIDFLADAAAVTLVGCGMDNVIVLRSPSKFFGLAGVRSGVAWSRQPLQAQWCRRRTNWPVSAFAAEALRR